MTETRSQICLFRISIAWIFLGLEFLSRRFWNFCSRNSAGASSKVSGRWCTKLVLWVLIRSYGLGQFHLLASSEFKFPKCNRPRIIENQCVLRHIKILPILQEIPLRANWVFSCSQKSKYHPWKTWRCQAYHQVVWRGCLSKWLFPSSFQIQQ